MRYKWIALVFVYALLLCGCRQAETGGSVHNDTDTAAATVTGITTTDTTVISTTSVSTERITSPVTTSSKKANTTITPYTSEYFKTWEAYEDALQSVRTKKDLKALFSSAYKRVYAMPMFLEDRFFVLPSGDANFYPHCFLDSRGYSSFLVLLKDGCEDCRGEETIEITIRHDKTPITVANSAWMEREPYTTMSGLEIVPYHTGYRNGRFCVTEAYGYAISLDVSTYCDCAKAVVDTLTFEKVEIK